MFGASDIPFHLIFFYIVLVSDTSMGIRLVDGNETSGLVEVLRNSEWRSVCDDFWSDKDAMVACGQLGFLPYGMLGMYIIAPV